MVRNEPRAGSPNHVVPGGRRALHARVATRARPGEGAGPRSDGGVHVVALVPTVERLRGAGVRLDVRDDRGADRHFRHQSTSRESGCQLGSRFSAKRARAFLLVGMAPHRDELARSGPARVGESELERAPQCPLRRGHRGRRVPRDLLGQLLGGVAQTLGRVDHLAHHAELVRTLRGHALVPAHEGHPHHSLDGHPLHQPDRLDRNHLTDRHVRVEELRVRRGDHDVGVGDPVEPATRADPVDRRDHRLPHLVLPGREVQVELLHRLAVPPHALAVGGDLVHINTGLERAPLTRVHDHPHVGIGIERAPRDLELVTHARVHRVELSGAVVEQPAHRAPPFQLERLQLGIDHGVLSSASQSARFAAASSAGACCAIRSARSCATIRNCAGGSTTSLTIPSS